MKQNQKGFSLVDLFFAFVIFAVLMSVGLFIVEHRHNQRSSTISVKNGEVRLYGKITEDDCFTNGTANNNGGQGLPIGDVGCSITVNGYFVGVRVGNIAPSKTPGTVSGLKFDENQVGHYADVYAKRFDKQNASIWDASKYYVKIY